MNVIKSQLSYSKWQEQLRRMSTVQKVLDYYNNNYTPYITSILKKVYPNNYKVLVNFIRKYPIVMRLTDDVSILFRNKPAITINNPSQQIVQQYIENSNLYSILPIANRLSNLVYKIGLLPRIYNNTIIVDILTPEKCWVQQVPGFPTQINALYYLNDTSTDSLTGYQVNTATKITNQYIYTIQISSSGEQKILVQQQNPYGYIPVVWIQTEPAYDTFWTNKVNPLPQMNEYYVISKTYQAFAIAYQAIATMVTKGLDPKSVVPFGPSTWIDLPTNMGQGQSDAKYITPGTDFDSMRKFSQNILQQSSALMGLSAQSYKKAQSFASGYALQLSKTDVMDYNSMQISMWQKALRKLIAMIVDTINIYTEYNLSNNDISVNITLPEVKISYNEQLDIYAKQLSLGLSTVQQILWKLNPQYTQQQIKQKLEKLSNNNTNQISE